LRLALLLPPALANAWTGSYYPKQVWRYNASENIQQSQSVSSMLYSLGGNVAQLSKLGSVTEANCARGLNATCQHTNDEFRREALAFLGNQTAGGADAKPFFLYWAPTAPHAGDYVANDALTSPVRRLGDRVGQSTMCRRGHAAQIEQHIDQDIKALLDLLDANPALGDNTLVVFATDNGPHADCQDDPAYTPFWFGGTANLRGWKRTLWEGGLRSPTMVRWPGHVKPGSITRFPHALYDLGLTFIDIAGLDTALLNTTGPLGGPGGSVSLKNVWLGTGPAPVRPYLHLEWCSNNDPTLCQTATLDVSAGEPSAGGNQTLFKLYVANALGSKSPMLFNILADAFETTNLVALPAVQAENAQLKLWREMAREPFCYGTPGCVYWLSTWTHAPTTHAPSQLPTQLPTRRPSQLPTRLPTRRPSQLPTRLPTHRPTAFPTTPGPTTSQVDCAVSPSGDAAS
jgi:hypothetical protein